MKKRRFQNFEHFEHFEQKNFGWTIPLLQVNFQEYVEIHGVAKNFVKKFFIQFQKGYT